jgi:hypothetical protein
MKKIMLVLVMFAVAQLNLAHAQKPGVVVSDKAGWHKVGEVKADFKMEKESIVVMGADMFKSIKLMVTDAPINIVSLKVYYEDGMVDDVTVRSEIKAGGETRSIDVKMKDIKKVEFVYKTIPNAKEDKAHVELYGMK